MELNQFNEIDAAARRGRYDLLRLGMALLFILAIMFFASEHTGASDNLLLTFAAMIAAYMAMNIGANDVANNVGPAVGSTALRMGWALTIAALFELSGALLAGGEVVTTIKEGIIDPAQVPDSRSFVWLMMAALFAAALWINIATFIGAPVSTTHAIVGGVLGAGVAAGGWHIANWPVVGAIASSWLFAPVLSGLIAAAILYFIKRSITYQADMIAAAMRIVPILVALMVGAFAAYLGLKGLAHVWRVNFAIVLSLGLAAGISTYLWLVPSVRSRASLLPNEKSAINSLFNLPLIFAAALLSFAHGANDVANAIGPLAAIQNTLQTGDVMSAAAIPLWVMLVGALGIVLGLVLFRPKLIRTVGSEITELDQMRAFSVVTATALTVILATQLGLPVSSTHVAVGGVFGVGFLREYLKQSYERMVDEIRHHHPEGDQAALEAFLRQFQEASIHQKALLLHELKGQSLRQQLKKRERRALKRLYRQELVKRSILLRIVLAWMLTVPAAGALAALFFFTIRGIMLP